MKKVFQYLIPILFLPVLSGCDNIDEDNRYIDLGPVEVGRKVFLEEFTGQRCTNCPDAHAIIELLEEQYGDNLIVVSVHAGYFGVKYPTGLQQEEGDQYAARWGVEVYPSGVVDYKGGVLKMDEWSDIIMKEIGLTTPLELVLEANVNEEGDAIDVFTTLGSSSNLSGNLQLWVVENDIKAYQIYGSQVLYDYVHNNVFRACVNGLWGEPVAVTAGELKYVNYSVAINPDWKLENVRIVGFYYNDSGVLQVERCKVEE
ncbi:MAG: Omp28 family outer membrane lipoprotein [Muribaculaceae bacterium]|nr:Omp28 family outer membrane lipoprotein [Muribaculaceae bacterium]